MEQYNEMITDVSQGGTMFQLTFYTNSKKNFQAMQDMARTLIDGNEPYKHWIRVLHKVDPGYYSMRCRNWEEYECPECGFKQERWTEICNTCRVRLLRPIDTRVVEE